MLLKRPRTGQDVDWSKITKTTVAVVTPLPPPVRKTLGGKDVVQLMASPNIDALLFDNVNGKNQMTDKCYFLTTLQFILYKSHSSNNI